MADRNRQFDRGQDRESRRRDRGERAGQERGWEDANRRRQGPDIPGEPGNWREDEWRNQRDDWGDRRSRQTGSWQSQGDVDYRRERHQEDTGQRGRGDFRDPGRDWRDMGDWAERQRDWEERGGLQSERADWQDQPGSWYGNRQEEERGPNRRQDRWGEDWQRDDWRRQPDDWRRQGEAWRQQRDNWERGGQGQQNDWRRQPEGGRRQPEDWRNQQPERWENRQRRGPGGDWEERSRREQWFARNDRESQDRWPEDEYGDENFYANRGWTRPSSPERDRDWGYYRGRQIAGDRHQDNQRGLPIDYIGSGEDQRDWRNEREFGRGTDADRELNRRRAGGQGQQGQDWEAQRNRPWDEGQEMSRERGFDQGENWHREDWNRSGPYSGMGPQGYRRSDDRIKEEVCERLTWHGQIDASKIEIDVKEGEVILRGQVGRKNEKRLAEDVVEKIEGVKDVQNQLRVSQ